MSDRNDMRAARQRAQTWDTERDPTFKPRTIDELYTLQKKAPEQDATAESNTAT